MVEATGVVASCDNVVIWKAWCLESFTGAFREALRVAGGPAGV